jgi:hypothetical protein
MHDNSIGLIICKCTRLLIISLASLLSLYGSVYAQAPTHGRIEGNAYIDPRFGLRYTFPSQLEVQATMTNGIPVGTGEKSGGRELLFDAMEKPNGQVRSGVLIIAIDMGVMRPTDVGQYLKAMLIGMGVKDVPSIKPVTIAGRSFYRSDAGFGTTVRSYGAQLATSCNGHFVIFIFSGASPERIESLVHSMDGMEMKCSNDSH